MARFSLSLLVLVLHTAVCSGQVLKRVWTDVTGKHSVEATLVEVNGGGIVWQKDDGREQEVSVKRLSKECQEFVAAVRHCDQNKRQFELIEKHGERMVASPTAVADIIDQLYRDSDEGTAAGLYVGTLNAAAGDPTRLSRAERQLDETIKRLRSIRKVFPEMHKFTLESALNNRAIVALRQGRPGSAVKFFADAAALSDSIPFAVYHNATILIEVANKTGRNSYLNSADRRKLMDVVSTSAPKAPGTKVPQRYVYSLSHNVFGSLFDANVDHNVIDAKSIAASPSNPLSGLVSLGLWPELTCMDCSGKGFVRCSKCKGGVVSEHRREQVGLNPINGQPIIGTKVYKIQCENCKGNGGFKCAFCREGRLSMD